MSEKKLSRRDAMKLLGAAIGAAALANLPSKWDKPELAQGVLPAHARQSAVACVPIVRTAVVGTINNGVGYQAFALNAPITAAEIRDCYNLVEYTWDGMASTGDPNGFAYFRFPGGGGGSGFCFSPNPLSPPISGNPLYAVDAPFTHISISCDGVGTWDVGNVTITVRA
jgi:hypothetical protein